MQILIRDGCNGIVLAGIIDVLNKYYGDKVEVEAYEDMTETYYIAIEVTEAK